MSLLWSCPSQQLSHGGHFSVSKNGQRLCQGCVRPRWCKSNKTARQFAMGVSTRLTVLEVQPGWFPLQREKILYFYSEINIFILISHHTALGFFRICGTKLESALVWTLEQGRVVPKQKVSSFFLKMESWGFSSRGPGFNSQHPHGAHSHLKL